MNSGWIHSVKGPVPVEQLGLILPHEHLFTDLRGPSVPDYAQGDPDAVALALTPNMHAAYANGATVLVECSTVGVGRNVAILKRLAEETPMHLIAPTGVYREGFVPSSLRDLSVEALSDLWIRDLTEGMNGTPIRAGFIKIAMSDDGPTPLEVRNLKAAARASKQTGATIGSHTVGGKAARRELDILEGEGLNLGRFIWIHTQSEPDTTIHIEAAKRGAYIEYDSIGARPNDTRLRDFTLALVEAGYAHNILLSHDAGWYQPGRPGGIPENGALRGYTALMTEFIPALRASGMADETIHLLTVTNPARAFAFAHEN